MADWHTGTNSTSRSFHSMRLAIVLPQSSTSSFQLENCSFLLPFASFPVISGFPLFSYLVTQAQILILRDTPSNSDKWPKKVQSGRLEGAERYHFQDTVSVGFSLLNEWGETASQGGSSPSTKGVCVCLFLFGQYYVSSSFAWRFLRYCENHFPGRHFYYKQLSGKQVTWWSSFWDLIENCSPCSCTIAI